MKITVSRKAMSTALAHCCAAATKNSTMPILKCVQLVPNGEGFTLRSIGDGMKMAVTCEVKAQLTQPEPMCINAHDLFDRVKALPEGDIKIVTKDGKLTLQALNRKLGISYLSADDFPKLPDPTAERVHVSAMLLAEAIKSTLFAVSDDSSNVMCYGLHIKLGGGSLAVNGTDSKRVASFAAPCDGSDFEALIPKPSAMLLRGLLDGAAGDVGLCREGPTFYAGINSLGLAFGCVTLDETKFPVKVAEVMALPLANRSEIVTQAALDAVKALTAVGGRMGHVTLSRKGNTVNVSAVSDDSDESSDEFMATEGEGFDAVKFQGAYLIEALSACGTETCELSIQSDKANAFIWGGKTRHAMAPVT